MIIKIGDTLIATGQTGLEIRILVLDMRLVGDHVLVDIRRETNGRTDDICVNLDNLTFWLGERQWRKL